jgi:hypothetical protein
MCREITKRPFQNLKVEWVEIASKFGHFKVPTEGPLRVDTVEKLSDEHRAGNNRIQVP